MVHREAPDSGKWQGWKEGCPLCRGNMACTGSGKMLDMAGTLSVCEEVGNVIKENLLRYKTHTEKGTFS